MACLFSPTECYKTRTKPSLMLLQPLCNTWHIHARPSSPRCLAVELEVWISNRGFRSIQSVILGRNTPETLQVQGLPVPCSRMWWVVQGHIQGTVDKGSMNVDEL